MQSNTGSLAPEFSDCIDALHHYKVSFVLVGGYAVGFHGVVRATGHIDLLYKQTEQNVNALCAALRRFGAPEHLIDRNFLLSKNAVTQIGLEPLRIDLLSSISGVSFEEVRSGAESIILDSKSLLVIGLNELRRNKAATGRAKDKQDLQRLQQFSAGNAKVPRIRRKPERG